MLALCSLALGCSKGDAVPAFAEVQAFTMTTASAQGAATIKVTDAWVTLDDELIGVWELPARIPLLGEGSHKLALEPAIKRNGAFDDRLRYPFYTAWSGTVQLQREATVMVQPATAYTAETSVWNEGFEDPFSQFQAADDSDTALIRFTPAMNPDVNFLGDSPCAGFRLDAEHPFARAQTDEDFESFGGPAFLEIDHQGDATITVGLLYFAGGQQRYEPYIYLPPTQRADGTLAWNKVYVDLSGFFNSNVSERDLYISAQLPAGRSSAQVYFDNIKLLRIEP